MRTFSRTIYKLLGLALILFLLVGTDKSEGKRKRVAKQIKNISAIVADERYYSQAVIEYYLTKAVLSRFGTFNEGTGWMTLNLSKIKGGNEEESQEVLGPLKDCSYKVPQGLRDLNSGLNYKYFLFDGSMHATMQAFGMADGNLTEDTQILVIDYLQYKDCTCDGLPTIRYAVGLRTELKFVKLHHKTDFQGVGSLASIAAQVQLGQSKITFSLKSIGLTGPGVRFNIPTGVDFDVTTYREFQNAIEFLRGLEIQSELIDSKNAFLADSLKQVSSDKSNQSNGKEIVINPTIIPVLDDYRTNFETSVVAVVKEMQSLTKLSKKLKRNLWGIAGKNKNIDYCDPTKETYNPVKCSKKHQLTIIDQQIRTYATNRFNAYKADALLAKLDRYDFILDELENEGDGVKAINEILFDLKGNIRSEED